MLFLREYKIEIVEWKNNTPFLFGNKAVPILKWGIPAKKAKFTITKLTNFKQK